MSARFIIRDDQLDELRRLLFDRADVEGAAFLLCGQTRADDHVSLIAHCVVPIDPQDLLVREAYRLSIGSRALTQVAKLAKYEGLSVAFAHSHPGGTAHFSEQDDAEELRLLPFLIDRVPNRIHGTLVLNETDVVARLYCPEQRNVQKVLSIGRRYTLMNPVPGETSNNIFNRQVRAFGPDIQRVLTRLHVGIVGLGGTGSPLAEQLTRLGVGELSFFDGDRLADTNINRVYGSTVSNVGDFKTDIAKNRLDATGIGAAIHSIPKSICSETAALELRRCDVIFGCTDKQIPRAILTQLSLRYSIPIIDVGVLIESKEQQIQGIYGRVTTLQPGEACLFCRGRISPEGIRVESLSPEERQRRAEEGYAPELEAPAPAVIPFTSAVASAAVSELLHRLTGFMGADRESSELLMTFDASRIRTNRVEPREDCFCSDRSEHGRGDDDPFLGMLWATPPS